MLVKIPQDMNWTRAASLLSFEWSIGKQICLATRYSLSYFVEKFLKVYTIHNSFISWCFIIADNEKKRQKQEALVLLVSFRFFRIGLTVQCGCSYLNM